MIVKQPSLLSSLLYRLFITKSMNTLVIFLFLLLLHETSTTSSDIPGYQTKDEIQRQIMETYTGVQITHYDCNPPIEIQSFDTNFLPTCKISSEDIKYAPTTLTLNRRHFKSKLFTVICTLDYVYTRQPCHNINYHDTIHSLSLSYTLTPEECTNLYSLDKTTYLVIPQFWPQTTFYIPFRHSYTLTTYQYATNNSVNHKPKCDTQGMTNIWKFTSFINTLELQHNDNQLTDRDNNILPCKVEQYGCPSFQTKTHVYTWNFPRNIQMQTISPSFTTDIIIWDARHFIIHKPTLLVLDDTAQAETYNTQLICEIYTNHTTKIDLEEYYPTSLPNLFIQILSEESNSSTFTNFSITSQPLTNDSYQSAHTILTDFSKQLQEFENNTEEFETLVRNTALKLAYSPLYPNTPTKYDYPAIAYKLLHNDTTYGNYYTKVHNYITTSYTFDTLLNRVLEIQKLDYLNEIQAICEKDRRTHLLALSTAHTNPPLAGHILTNDHSQVLFPLGLTTQLQKCRLLLSPLIQLTKCYEQLPIFYKSHIQFIDRNTRLIIDPFSATQIECEHLQNLPFHANQYKEKNWYLLTPHPYPTERPQYLLDRRIPTFFPLHDQAMETTQSKLHTIIQTYLDKHEKDRKNQNVITLFLQQIQPYIANQSLAYGYQAWLSQSKRIPYIDHLISLSYFPTKFRNTFGNTAYILEKCAIYYALYLLAKQIFTILRSSYHNYYFATYHHTPRDIPLIVLQTTLGILPYHFINSRVSAQQSQPLTENTQELQEFSQQQINVVTPVILTPFHNTDIEQDQRPIYPNLSSYFQVQNPTHFDTLV